MNIVLDIFGEKNLQEMAQI